ncbi:tetratricopeptide repeat protein [bacterium]|nr:tetratricopeptide repeat protein [bacterium]
MAHKIKHKVKLKKEEEVQQTPTEAPEEIVYQDQFIDVANKALTKSVSHKYLILVLFIGAFIATAIYSYKKYTDDESSAERASLFFTAQEVFERPVVSVDSEEKLETAFATTEEKYKTAVSMFESFAIKHNDSELGSIATLYAANSLFEMGKLEDSIRYYESFINKTKVAELKEVAKLKLAKTLYLTKEYDKALNYLEQLISSTNSYIASASLFQKGEIYESKNQKDKAKESFQKILKDFEGSFYAIKAQKKLTSN